MLKSHSSCMQAMMKDQFANYVVQKVLETCDDHQRELILSRIKVHLNALKKYTYGKHIVARVEKLVAAGGTSPCYSPFPFLYSLLSHLLISDVICCRKKNCCSDSSSTCLGVT